MKSTGRMLLLLGALVPAVVNAQVAGEPSEISIEERVSQARAKSAALSPKDRQEVKALFSSAFQLWKSGDFNAARLGFENGLVRDPANGIAHYYLAETLTRLKQNDRLEHHYEMAAALMPGTPEGLKAAIAFAELPKRWIPDANGCKAWSPNPAPGQTVTWSGTCVNGLIEGPGEFRWFRNGKPGSVETGTWKTGKREGAGTVLSPDGTRFEGEYRDGLRNGSGTEVRADGTYVGEFRDGVFHGRARLVFARGGFYEGEFKSGFPDGFGKFIDASGNLFEGAWERGCLNNPNGRKAWLGVPREKCGF